MTEVQAEPSDLPKEAIGHCHCGRTRFRLKLDNVAKDLALSAFCHCSKCQRLNGAPFIWTTHWEERAVEWLAPHASSSDSSTNSRHAAEPAPPAVGPRTKGGARLHALSEGDGGNDVSVPSAVYTSEMDVFEAMKGRKWKQRCATCGTPMGSWNEAKKRWSVWPSTLARDHPAPYPEGAIHPAILHAIRPDHHQFYGPWKLVTINDDLDKWEGYRESSQRM